MCFYLTFTIKSITIKLWILIIMNIEISKKENTYLVSLPIVMTNILYFFYFSFF